jgi:hypothetical protein
LFYRLDLFFSGYRQLRTSRKKTKQPHSFFHCISHDTNEAVSYSSYLSFISLRTKEMIIFPGESAYRYGPSARSTGLPTYPRYKTTARMISFLVFVVAGIFFPTGLSSDPKARAQETLNQMTLTEKMSLM